MKSSTDSFVLTIAIPTFDRNQHLERCVGILLPQLRPGVQLVICDNASPNPVSESLAALLASGADGRVQVIRNRCNIGGNANILRCLEECQTEWVWVLGDDDEPLPNAVDQILQDIETADESLVSVNYKCELFDRERALDLEGTEAFLRDMDSLSNVLFLSTSIFRAPALVQHLRLAYSYSYSLMPHVIALAFALGNHGKVTLAMNRIVSWHQGEFGQMWSVVNAALAFPTLLDVPPLHRYRQVLARKMEQDVHPEILGLARQLLMLACHEGDFAGARWTWGQIYYRRFAGTSWSFRRVVARCLTLLFVFPRLSHLVVERLARLVLGRRATVNTIQDRVTRI